MRIRGVQTTSGLLMKALPGPRAHYWVRQLQPLGQ
jgi:hypothetical protein